MCAVTLNVFQRLVRSWEAVHPYNAAQVVKVGEAITAQAAQSAWDSALASLGLGRVRVEGRRVCHEILNGDARRYPIRNLPPDADLATYLAAELNRPFSDPDEPPYRPFLINHAQGSTFGVVYQHWVADSVSIRMLLERWCEAIQRGIAIDALPIHPRSPGYWELFGSRRGELRIDQAVLGTFRSHMRFRRALKVKSPRSRDYDVRLILREVPAGMLENLRTSARAQGVTVGDILLAALTESASRHVPLQHRPNRHDVAVGNIVDLRPHAGRDLSDTFGLYLGFIHVVCRPADLRDWDRLLHTVHLQNRARRNDVAQASGTWMTTALAVQRLVPPEDLYHFYRKEIPLIAGLSNVNLNGTWAESRHPAWLRQYLRISPTGPMAPVVLSATTLGKNLHFALTYRSAILSEQNATDLLDSLLARLGALSEDRLLKSFT